MSSGDILLKELPSNSYISGPTMNGVEGVAEEQHRVSAKLAAKLRLAAIVVSWVSAVFSFTTGVAALVLGNLQNSEALFGYGLDATLDGISSIAVLWRFYGPEDQLYSEERERKACIVIGCLFIISGSMLFGKSLFSIITEVAESRDIVLYTAFALTTAVVAVALAIIKVYLGYKLESESLATDSIITFVGAAMSFAGVAGLEMYVQNTNLWFMDSVFGIICSLFLFIFGVKLLYEMICKRRRQNSHQELK